MTETVVLYHANCADGFTAAWCAYQKFGDDAVYLPVKYHEPPPEDAFTAEDLYIVDFSYKANVMKKLVDEVVGAGGKVTVLDHHKSAEEELAKLEEQDGLTLTFDMTKSGAMLSAEFFGVDSTLVHYVQDRDLWSWKLPHSQAINQVIQQTEMTFPNWDDLHIRLENDDELRDGVIYEGEAILGYRDFLVEQAASHHYMAKLAGHCVPCVNSPMLGSEIGNFLAKGNPFVVIYFVKEDGSCGISLRSDQDDPKAVDVKDVAVLFGGGGHKNAAGCSLPGVPGSFRVRVHELRLRAKRFLSQLFSRGGK